MALINRKPTKRQTLLAHIVLHWLENNIPMDPDTLICTLIIIGYTQDCLSDWRDFYLAKGFLAELVRLDPEGLNLTEENVYRFMKKKLAKPKKRRPRPKTRLGYSEEILLKNNDN